MRLQVTTLIIAHSTVKREEEVGKCCNTDIIIIKKIQKKLTRHRQCNRWTLGIKEIQKKLI